MDSATIKLTLSAYRPGTPDEDDPFFAEALAAVKRDPALTRWFAEEQRFDSWMVDTCQRAVPPEDLQALILLNAKAAAKSATFADKVTRLWVGQPAKWLAAAACVLLAFVWGRQTGPHLPPATSARAVTTEGSDRLALQAIAYTGKMPALQFVCFDASVVARWVAEKSAAMHMGPIIDKPLASMQMIGCSTAQWGGKPVIMIALQNKAQMGMLYLARASDFPGVAGNGEIMEKDGWVSKIGRSGEHLYVLTTKGTRQNLDFPMPL